MTTYWAIWDLVSANALADFDTESGALDFVRQLMELGWKADELVMIFDDPSLADEELPPGVTGDELVRRAQASGSSISRRTA
jgi:hypothetical protein